MPGHSSLNEAATAMLETADDLAEAGLIDAEDVDRLKEFLGSLPSFAERPEIPDEHTIVFIDIEATGLHATSVPIEVGLARLDLRTLKIESWGRLILSGHLVDPEWDDAVYMITGISPWALEDDGIPAAAVVDEMREWLGDQRIVVSDAPTLDARWLNSLLAAASAEGGESLELQVMPIARLRRMLPARVLRSIPAMSRLCYRPHRAEGDAMAFASAVAQAMRSHSQALGEGRMAPGRGA